MLKRLIPWQASVEPPAVAARVPREERIFAVGDIHGRLDLLDELLALIEADDAQRGIAHTRLIFLGDLIDRGPSSAEVVERLHALARRDPRARFLLGNHEEVFLSVMDGSYEALRFFIRIGGDATIRSYGISDADLTRCDLDVLMDLVHAAVPPAHVDFLKSFEDQIVVGDYAFVHAGIRPGVQLADQKPEDLRWIRNEFLRSSEPFEKMIIHGHTIQPEIDERFNRIGIDTGAYETGRLSAMGFENDERWVLQAGRTRGG